MHLPLPDVPEGIRSAIHGVRECQARTPALDARKPVDLRELERRRAEFLQWLRHPSDISRVASGSIAVTIAGLAVQQSEFPRGMFLNHNDIYHLIQLVALYLLFRCARTTRDRGQAAMIGT